MTMNTTDMDAIALRLVAKGKGILAADESLPTIEKRFKAIGVTSTPDLRRAYREMLFTTPGLGAFISGAILFDETLRQRTAHDESLPAMLGARGIIVGIKVDCGIQPMAGFPNETITEGLDGLRGRLREYAMLNARFTKWRAVIAIGPATPSAACIQANAQALARFAALSQEAGLVPIVEPEVLMDGEHSIERHFEVTETTIRSVFAALAEHRVRLEAMLLKPNMVLPGKTCPQQADIARVAELTRSCMLRVVPAAVPGIVFLSGGQNDILATQHLDALNRLGHTPWELSFSYGRALQAPALRAWAGVKANEGAAQGALIHRAGCNSAARFGDYQPEKDLAA